MSNAPSVFIAIMFFILGSIACHLYKRHIIRDLEDALLAWKLQSEIATERLASWKCLRPHVGDINNIQDDITEATGIDLKLLIKALDEQLKDVKETFGI